MLGLGLGINKGGFVGKSNPFKDATLALSLRDLGLGATHVVRVRRDSDNNEQDFTANEITDGTLLSFVGSGNGFVSTWYNQLNTGLNFTQTSGSLQPSLIKNGILNLINGKPAIIRNALSDVLISNYQPNGLNRKVFGVLGNDSVGNDNCYISSGITSDFIYLSTNQTEDLSNKFNILEQEINSTPTTITRRNQISAALDVQSLSYIRGDVFFGQNKIRFGYTTGFDTGMFAMQEFILFENDVNKTGINQNINNYYAIY